MPSGPLRAAATQPPRRLADRDRQRLRRRPRPPIRRRYYARPDITYRPVTGVSPTQAGIAWPPAADTNPVTCDFVHCCLDNKPPQHPATSPDQR
jgi:hypothetical protein